MILWKAYVNVGGDFLKLQTKIRFAIDMLIESPVNFFISVLLSGIGFGLFGFTLFVYLAGNNGINSAERVLSNGVKQTGIIELDEFYDDKGKEFRKQVYSSEINVNNLVVVWHQHGYMVMNQ